MTFRTHTLLLIAVLAVGAGLGLGLIVARAQQRPAAETASFQHIAIALCWNDAVASVGRENPLWNELSESLHAEPPHRSVSARRLELYRLILAEREQQVQAVKCLQTYEAKP